MCIRDRSWSTRIFSSIRMSRHSRSIKLRASGSISDSMALRASACPGVACWLSCAWSPILVCSSDPNRWPMHGHQVRAWLACETAWIPQPTERHADLLNELLALPGVHGNLVPDAHLAALALGHGLTLCSTDGDFARFPILRWQNPIAT